MRKSIRAAAAAIALAAFGVAQATAAMASGTTYTVVNTNGEVAIQHVWSAPAGERDVPWRAATMSYAIAPGTQSTFDIVANGNCFFDVKIRFSDGAEQTFSNVDVCRGTRLIAA